VELHARVVPMLLGLSEWSGDHLARSWVVFEWKHRGLGALLRCGHRTQSARRPLV